MKDAEREGECEVESKEINCFFVFGSRRRDSETQRHRLQAATATDSDRQRQTGSAEKERKKLREREGGRSEGALLCNPTQREN